MCSEKSVKDKVVSRGLAMFEDAVGAFSVWSACKRVGYQTYQSSGRVSKVESGVTLYYIIILFTLYSALPHCHLVIFSSCAGEKRTLPLS